ncbi:TPA: hypothetical protein LVN30_000954 [Klebsiella oxytoca]|nr:hypothetical protein [Klebsiella oxytoca]
MNNEIERIAQHNDMSVEFVTWFFNEKKSACGEHWFLVLGAMWEGWRGRSIEMDRLAAENVGLRLLIAENWNMRDLLRQLMAGRPGGVYFNKWEKLIIGVLNEPPPATARILAEAEARGVEKFAAHLRANDNGTSVCKMIALGADDFAKQLRDGGNGE